MPVLIHWNYIFLFKGSQTIGSLGKCGDFDKCNFVKARGQIVGPLDFRPSSNFASNINQI